MMKAQGIMHRSARCVYFKIHNLERTYKSVKVWLENKQQLDLLFCGKAAKKIEAAVFKRCPSFMELSPIFENVGHTSTSNDGEEHEENKAVDAQELSGEDAGFVEDTGGVLSKRKRQGDSSSRSIKRGKKQMSPHSPTAMIPFPNQTGLKDAGTLLKCQSVLEDISGGSYRDTAGATVSGKAGERMAERLIESELKHKEDLAKVRLDAERKIAEVRTKLETMLSRQKLKSAGCSDEDVNGIFPL